MSKVKRFNDVTSTLPSFERDKTTVVQQDIMSHLLATTYLAHNFAVYDANSPIVLPSGLSAKSRMSLTPVQRSKTHPSLISERERFKSALKHLPSDKEANIYINSIGGLLSLAYQIVNIAKDKPIVRTINTGLAASSSAYMLTAAGSLGHRYALRSSKMQLHSINKIAFGQSVIHFQDPISQAYDLLCDNEFIRKHKESSPLDLSSEFVSALLRKDLIELSAMNALELGFIDAVMNRDNTCTIRAGDDVTLAAINALAEKACSLA